MPRWGKKARHTDESGPSQDIRSKRQHDRTPPPSSSSEGEEYVPPDESDHSSSEEAESISPEDSSSYEPMEGDDDEPPFDHIRFRNLERQVEFDNYWSNKTVLCERGIRLSHFPALRENIMTRGWERAMTFYASADPMLVREFYANVKLYEPDEGERQILARVRGRRFRLKVSTIATFLEIPRVDDPGYPFPEDPRPSRDILAAALSEGTQRRWGYVPQFLKKNMSPFYRALHEMTCSQILPLVHDDSVNQGRALLLYAIATEVPIDLAEVIFDTIIQRARNTSIRSVLPCGGLLTALIAQFGVVVAESSRTVRPSAMISKATDARREAQLRLRASRSSMPAGTPSASGPSSSTAPSGVTAPPGPSGPILQRDMMHRMDQRLQHIETEQAFQRGSLAGIEAEQAAQRRLLEDQGVTLRSILEAMRAMGPNSSSTRPPSP